MLNWIINGVKKFITSFYLLVAVFCFIGVINPYSSDNVLGRVFILFISLLLLYMWRSIHKHINQ